MSLGDLGLRKMSPAFLDAADRDAFHSLPSAQQERVRKLTWLMWSIEANHTGGRSLGAVLRGLYRIAPELADFFAPKHATRLYASWQARGHDWRVLLDHRPMHHGAFPDLQ